ncbi:MAG TPA: S41 family peptidase [Anaerolineales bacterium]|nr:S41 family peptidase [Anaerolineales bacterium]
MSRNRILILAILPLILASLACQAILGPANGPSIGPTLLPTATQYTPPAPTAGAAPTAGGALNPAPTRTPASLDPVGMASATPEIELQVTVNPIPTPLSLDLQLDVFEDVWNVVNDGYVYADFNGVDWDAAHDEYRQRIQAGLSNDEFYTTVNEMIALLGDDHSYFLDPQAVIEEDAEYKGNLDYVGIGVLITAAPERSRAVIILVFPGSPAEAAGLQSRDSIISVGGESILDEEGYLRDIVRGPEGTIANVLVQTPGQAPREIQIPRHRITGGYPVPHTVLTSPNGQRIGYILLPSFADTTVDEQFGAAIEAMTSEAPLDGLVVDNRMNGGGADTVLRPTLGYFLAGVVGNFTSRYEERALRVEKLTDVSGSSTLPLVVLIGPDTVSYGEVFAGVLSDSGRAYLIGETTGGNVETLWGYDFDDGSRLWIASETFRPINHPEQDWEQTGIIPNLEIPVIWDEYTVDTDPAVLAALDFFDRK